MATYFPLKTLWRSYFCALVATGVLAVRLTRLAEFLSLIATSGYESFSHWPTGHVPGEI
jgi:hypothetical protein